jgi:hypothetical protein|tara:strand:+ start:1727 stop:1984 length:258 start_codon:yes stop_codon:yes gene_type:complete
MDSVVDMISKYGFPVIAACGLGYFVYYIWKWVTTEIKPVIEETTGKLIGLIDKVRMLDNDMIRLTMKINLITEEKPPNNTRRTSK